MSAPNIQQPAPGSGFVSNFIDAAYNQNIFLWDTAFITMFANLAAGVVPGIEALDNFYCKQHPSGLICREIERQTGVDFDDWINHKRELLFSRVGWRTAWDDPEKRARKVEYLGREAPDEPPELTLDALNHPICAWAELESYRQTGDRERLERVFDPLDRYFRALDLHLRQGNGLYITDWASMDNSSRTPWLDGGGTAIDTSSEMVLFARNMADIARADRAG